MTSFTQRFEILVIDDDGVDRQNIRRILAPLRNISITEAQSGEHAMQILSNLKPSLVITDIFMPNLDGLEFLTQLATKGIDFPVIAVTGQNDSQHVDFLRVAQSFGAVHSMEKRDLERDLVKIVRELLDGKAGDEYQTSY